MDAARAVLAERGFATEVMEIASRANVGAGTLYRNFGTKRALMAAVVLEMSHAFEAAAVEASRHESARAGLEIYIRAGFGLMERYGRLLLDQMAGGSGGAFETEYDRERVHALLLDMLRRGIALGELPEDLDVRFALAMLQGLFSPRGLETLLESHTLGRFAGSAVDFYLKGIGASVASVPA